MLYGETQVRQFLAASSLSLILVSLEIQTKLDQERAQRQKIESKLLESEKKNSVVAVDMSQMQQKAASLQAELNMEKDKVGLKISVLRAVEVQQISV